MTGQWWELSVHDSTEENQADLTVRAACRLRPGLAQSLLGTNLFLFLKRWFYSHMRKLIFYVVVQLPSVCLIPASFSSPPHHVAQLCLPHLFIRGCLSSRVIPKGADKLGLWLGSSHIWPLSLLSSPHLLGWLFAANCLLDLDFPRGEGLGNTKI